MAMPTLASTESVLEGWAVNPMLPQGLRISDRGIIEGTPGIAAPLRTYTVSAYNTEGSTNTSVSLFVGCPAGMRVSVSGTSCVPCPRGEYRLQTSSDLDGLYNCTPCAANRSTETEGAQSQRECKCDAGYQLLTDDRCEMCPKGLYKSSVSDSACGSCGAFRTTHAPGASSESMCVCVSGYFFDKDGNNDTCIRCTPGFYCPEGDDRLRCPTNMTIKSAGARGRDECVCAKGQHELYAVHE
ncbi:unnamed protein product [Vitrella brassicaformis CCMP3155]|uniref:Tyrosine-protein kinase ephrin type A/B receptor-like domain-containing protein n=1 Tax=Vitrella brassicaformis (strain CCMP3155) TaxID=1169540 RepID=A0A0G4GTJ6_VITBC|nr:unnamed protein product [Vitrella brassicaformis CCMP3155]|eukprot:CEM34045.1 unnamed protein product [Vitrella brassicaformis CCMP3155]